MDFYSEVGHLQTPGRRRFSALQPCENTTTPLPPSHPFANPPNNFARRRPRPQSANDSPYLQGGFQAVEGYKFTAACSSRPHPEKVNAGEDAFFFTPSGSAMGVADGVGGWAELGIDSGEFSRELMAHADNYIQHTDCKNPQEALVMAYEGVQATGSSTACICVLDGKKLKASNLGDSGFIIFRYIQAKKENSENDPFLSNCQSTPQNKAKNMGVYRAVYRSEDQQHYFNCPRQLGTNSVDNPSDADTYSVEVVPNDIVLLGTDGVFDNLSAKEICAELNKYGRIHEKDLSAVANDIVKSAFRASKDTNRMTPFARNAQVNGMCYLGGKMDDITVVLGMVTDKLEVPICPLDFDALSTPGRSKSNPRIIPGTPDTTNSTSSSSNSEQESDEFLI